MIEYTATEQAAYDETIATLEACGFTVTKRLGLTADTVLAEKTVGDRVVNLSYGIHRPNVRLRIKGFGRTAKGNVVHLKDQAAIRTFARSQQHG